MFKIFYPYADFFSDSYTYIGAAIHHNVISFRPTGYSRFLELVHFFTKSDTAVVFIQYITIQTGGLFLFFTLLYFFHIRKTRANILFAFLVFNPATIYISNCICSDALFIGLSLYWITILVWIINRPLWYHMIIQAILLFFLFKLRFAALYYPVISVIALILCKRPWWFKTAGITLTILPIAFEIQHTISLTRKITGTAIFSAFSGWQIANNVLNMYPHIRVDTSALPSRDCIELDSIVRKYFNAYPTAGANATATTDYMWNKDLPLKTYMYYRMSRDKNLPWFKAWHRVAPVYTEYGYSLIKKHPVAYARYYLWPTTITYLLPPIESLGIYNEGKDDVNKIAQIWFWYKSTRVTATSKTFQRLLLTPYTYLFFALNIIFGWLLVTLLLKQNKVQRVEITILLIGILWIVHGGFTIFSTPVIYRYQHFTFIVLFAFSLIAIEQLTKYYLSNKPGSIK